MLKKNHIAWGMVWGLLVPFLVIAIIYGVMMTRDLVPTNEFLGQIIFLGIAFNLIPARYFHRRKIELTSRGVMAITMLEVVAWAILFVIE
ncbi:MAG: hypothetical protein ACI9J3_001624 [Parvicellaceae bacterium]|jgi:hypothetical protein